MISKLVLVTLQPIFTQATSPARRDLESSKTQLRKLVRRVQEPDQQTFVPDLMVLMAHHASVLDTSATGASVDGFRSATRLQDFTSTVWSTCL